MNNLLLIFLGPTLVAVACVAWGRVALRVFHADLYREEENLMAFLVGAAVVAGEVLALAALHLARRGAFTVLAAAGLALALWMARRRADKRLPALPWAWRIFFVAALAAYGFIDVANAAAPELTGGDTLGLVLREWRARHLLGFPDGMRMLLLFAFSFGRHSSAALVHCAFLFVLPLLMVGYTRRLGVGGGAGVLAALLVFTSPLVARNGTAALEETALAAVVFGVFYFIELRRAGLAILLAVFALSFRGGGLPDPLHWPNPVGAAILGGESQGFLGPLFLLAPLALLAARELAGRQLLAAAAVAGLVFGIIPALPFVALALALAVARAPAAVPLLVVAQVFFCWPAVTAAYCDRGAWRLARVPVMEALRRVPEERVLESRLPGYGLISAVEKFAPAGAGIFTFVRLSPAYTTRQVTADPVLRDALRTALDPGLQPTTRLRFPFAARRLRRLRITGPLHITEFRVFAGGKEIPRRPEWRLRAYPGLSAAPLAFDNSRVTHGWFEWVEVEFPQPEIADAVLLECPRAQAQSAPKLEGLLENGSRVLLADRPERSEAAPPDRLREEAAQECKFRGVKYLLVPDYDRDAADFRENDRMWGIVFLKELYGTRLYRVE